MVTAFFNNSIETIRTINRRYKTPHMKTTGLVRICLGLLRVYLLLLIGILVFKFFQEVRQIGGL